jgi:prepilin-type N-terminal cleavage/methylation domain-containing protein
MTPRIAARRGFTLLELLVVITIILILVSLGVSAYMRIANFQQRRNTETEVSKIDAPLQKHWRAVLDLAKTDQGSDIAMYLANNDSRRARVIYILMCLRREFPTNFTEATQTITVNGVSFGPNPSYANLVPPQATWGSYTPEQQSSMCLYMTLKQRRRGVDFDPDTGLSSAELVDPLNNGFKAIYDGWGRPVIFNRWPSTGYGSGVTNSAGQTVGTAQPFNVQSPPDTEDPEGLLADPTWVNWLKTQNLVATFNLAVGYPLGGAGQQYRLTPVIMSLGGNGKYDGALPGSDDIFNFRLTPLNQ